MNVGHCEEAHHTHADDITRLTTRFPLCVIIRFCMRFGITWHKLQIQS